MTSDPVLLLQQLVNFPSISGTESAIADFVENWGLENRLTVGRVEDNVFCSIGQGEPCLLFNSHLDVVPPSNDHPFDPFDPVIGDGRMFGRGTVDAKASGAAMLSALLNLSTEGWTPSTGKIIVALTACEETSKPKNGLQTLLPHLPKLDGAVIGEPTSLLPCFSQKGLLILEIVSHGRSAHAARPTNGINAITRAAEDLLRLDRMTFEKVHPQLGPVTCAATTITGGSARNVIPESCSFVVDIRSTPAYTHDELVALVEETLDGRVEVISNRYVPRSTPESSPIAVAVLNACEGASPFGSPTVSDWAFLDSIPAVKLGPGDSNLSHTGRESIHLGELKEAVGLYENIARDFFRQISDHS